MEGACCSKAGQPNEPCAALVRKGPRTLDGMLPAHPGPGVMTLVPSRVRTATPGPQPRRDVDRSPNFRETAQTQASPVPEGIATPNEVHPTRLGEGVAVHARSGVRAQSKAGLVSRHRRLG